MAAAPLCTELADNVARDATMLEKFVKNLDQSRIDYEYLWHHSNDMKEEIQLNRARSRIWPHCSVCQQFCPIQDVEPSTSRENE